MSKKIEKIIKEEILKENFIQTIKNFLTRKKPVQDLNAKQQELIDEIQFSFTNLNAIQNLEKPKITQTSIDVFITLNQAILIIKSLSELKQNKKFSEMNDTQMLTFLMKTNYKLKTLTKCLIKINDGISKNKYDLMTSKNESKLPGLEKLSSINIKNDSTFSLDINDLFAQIMPINKFLSSETILKYTNRLYSEPISLSDYKSFFDIFLKLSKSKKFKNISSFYTTLQGLILTIKKDLEELISIITEKQTQIDAIAKERYYSQKDSEKRTSFKRPEKVPYSGGTKDYERVYRDQQNDKDVFTSARY